MLPIRSMVIALSLLLASCSTTQTVEGPAPQFAQAGPPFPYNSFYCP